MKQPRIVLLSFFVLTMLTVCSKEESPTDSTSELTLSGYELQLNLNTDSSQGTVSIVSGNGGYKVESSNATIATATLSGSNIVITAQGKGSATITVTDAKRKSVTIAVTVETTETIDYSVMSHFHYDWDAGAIYIASKYDEERDLHISFNKCMYNNLMTFEVVGLENSSNEKPIFKTTRPQTIINLTKSDNIGPLNIAEVSSWFGGNHSYKEENQLKTAFTEEYRCYVDGQLVSGSMVAYAKQIKIEVVNRLYEPQSAIIENGKTIGFDATMCKETVQYLIQEGNIEVKLTHEWSNKVPYTINRYYGMQSMVTSRSNSIFFSRGREKDFQPKTQIRGNKQDYPAFDRFVQKGANNEWYESCYLTKDGIGNHSMLDGNQFIFYNDGKTQKTYHGLISGKKVSNGDSYFWRGVYSWVKPLIDNNNILAYIIKDSTGYIAIVDVKTPGEYEVAIPENIRFKDIKIVDNNDGFSISLEGPSTLKINASKTGSCYTSLVQK